VKIVFALLLSVSVPPDDAQLGASLDVASPMSSVPLEVAVAEVAPVGLVAPGAGEAPAADALVANAESNDANKNDANDGAVDAHEVVAQTTEQPSSDEPDAVAPAKSAPRPFHLMSAEKERRYRRLLPEVDDPNVARLLADPRLMLYTDAEMPEAYQFWSGDLPGLHRVSYNISADNSEPFGNGNREFPWSAPAGTHRAKNVSSFRFVWLPQDDQGRTLPVVWYSKHLRGDDRMGYAWTYPIGTIFGEVLTMRGPDRRNHTFELRLRMREAAHWEVDVFRPFPTANDLAERIRELRPDWERDEALVKLCGHVEGEKKLTVRTLVDRQPQRRVFSQKMGVDVLPDIKDEKLVIDLLTKTTFRSAVGQIWREGSNGTETCAPTTKAEFHVVPAGYDAGFIAVNNTSCMRCHDTVNQNVREFNAGRDWYGRVRGSDGIFSFHPFSHGSISDNGFGRPISMRHDLQKAGVIARFNAKVHKSSVYKRLKSLPE
jgi:hypothetical protein